jgi:hypothetical protein
MLHEATRKAPPIWAGVFFATARNLSATATFICSATGAGSKSKEYAVASAQTTEKADTVKDSDEFDPAGDLCDFGFVLAPPKPSPETQSDTPH